MKKKCIPVLENYTNLQNIKNIQTDRDKEGESQKEQYRKKVFSEINEKKLKF
jgi:hypothetical protein